MADYFALVTTTGLGKLASANAGGPQVVLDDIAVGDSAATPVVGATTVGGQQWREPINRAYVDPAAATRIVVEGIIPASAGGWTIRQVGIFDDDGDLFAIAKFPVTYKPAPAEGAARDMIINLVLEVGNASAVSVTVDPSAVLATQAWVTGQIGGFSVPDATETVKGKAEIATTAEVQTGTDHTRIVTPLGLASRTATETRTGIVERATDAEAVAGADTSRYVTPKHLKDATPLASTTVAGKVELATYPETAEMVAPSNSLAVTPAALNARQASTTQTGLVERATDVEAAAGADTIRYISPKQLADAIANLVPPGSLRPAAYATPDAGWLLCDGSSVSKTTYAALYAKIGDTWGSTSTTFKLPDYRGRVIVGAGQGSGLTNRSLGSTGGGESTTYSVPLKDHKHHIATNSVNASSSPGDVTSANPAYKESTHGGESEYRLRGHAGGTPTVGPTSEVGDGAAPTISVSKMQPYGTAHVFIKT